MGMLSMVMTGSGDAIPGHL